MRCAVPTLIAILVVTTPAVLADEAPQTQRQYTDRLLALADTAAAHAELAQWCEQAGLEEKADLHWQEAVHRDPDHKEARKALGYVWRNMTWVQAEAAPPDAELKQPRAAPRDPAFTQREQAFRKQIRAVAIRYLGSTDPETRREGLRQLFMIREPEAIAPITEVLGAGSLEMRVLACEVLGQIPGERAAKQLGRFVLTAKSAPVYRAAVEALADRGRPRGIPMLLNALNGSEKALQRSAYALGEMSEWRAVPALIDRLRTKEPRVKTYNAPGRGAISPGPSAYIVVGRIVTYVADVEPVVAEAAVGWDPKIGAIPVGTVLSIHNPRVTIHRTIIEFVRQPVVHEALRKITGQDFGYRADLWRDWLRRRESDHGAAR